MKKIYTVIFLFISVSSFSQEIENIDSLKNELSLFTKNDTHVVNLLMEIGESYSSIDINH